MCNEPMAYVEVVCGETAETPGSFITDIEELSGIISPESNSYYDGLISDSYWWK